MSVRFCNRCRKEKEIGCFQPKVLSGLRQNKCKTCHQCRMEILNTKYMKDYRHGHVEFTDALKKCRLLIDISTIVL